MPTYFNGLIEIDDQSGNSLPTSKCKEILSNMRSVKEITNFMLGISISEIKAEYISSNYYVTRNNVRAEKCLFEVCLIRAKELLIDFREPGQGPTNKMEHIFKKVEQSSELENTQS